MGGQVQPRFARQVPPEYVRRAEDDGPRRGREVAETGQEEKDDVMQLSDLKHAYDNYLASNDGKVPSCIQMGSLLFDEFKGFVDPIMDNAEKYSIPPPGPRKYLWKGVEVIRDESVKPYQFRMGK